MPTGPFKPGDKVPSTGIYIASHYQHRLPHEVFAVEGELFPLCKRCGMRASFNLFRVAADIELDQDFAASAESRKSKKAKAGPSGD
jgi:hypothetical protein